VQFVCSRVMLVIVHVLFLAVLSGPLLRLTGSFVAHVRVAADIAESHAGLACSEPEHGCRMIPELAKDVCRLCGYSVCWSHDCVPGA
jgi:hypothetical protein